MNRHGHSTDRVRGGGEFGAVWPGLEGRRHCNVSVVVGAVVVAGVVVVVRFSVGWRFVHFVSWFSWKLGIGIRFLLGVRREKIF